ncbi:MAG: tail fiber protein [Dehalococcoidales bacterium]|nr:tail fiber protein [Dehalococcoidales bacterium]
MPPQLLSVARCRSILLVTILISTTIIGVLGGDLAFSASPAFTTIVSPSDSDVLQLVATGGSPTGDLTATCTDTTLLPLVDSGSLTKSTGSPIPIMQPTLAVSFVILTDGTFPTADSGGNLGEIFMFAGNFAPAGTAFCNGQILSIATYNVLYAIIGTTYGGDGQSTFALPDLRGRVPMHRGTLGSNTYSLGQSNALRLLRLLMMLCIVFHHCLSHTHYFPSTRLVVCCCRQVRRAVKNKLLSLRQIYRLTSIKSRQ